MKTILFVCSVLVTMAVSSCAGKRPPEKPQDRDTVQTPADDTLRIANDDMGWEIIIIDPGFNGWLAANARPRGFHSQRYMESRNLTWVMEWNRRSLSQLHYGDAYQLSIDYRAGVDYGYEVNYLLFNYLVYFQQTNRTRLGGFAARL